jgi:hypothetical protein
MISNSAVNVAAVGSLTPNATSMVSRIAPRRTGEVHLAPKENPATGEHQILARADAVIE